MSTDILRIIEGGLNNDKKKIINYSTRLAQKMIAEGDEQLAECILEQLKSYGCKNSSTADAMRMIPFDSDSKLQIVEVIPEDKTRTNIVLSDNTNRQVFEFINIINNSEILEKAGIILQKTLLLYGAPGCGKTSIAHYISEQTHLPLVVARLDGIVSSLLGSTAKNIRKIFSYVASMPCILFLDEFDAIAKARDDNHELGELKRVINSLLQNIDSLPSSCILIAATNHPELLDKAVWRRFTSKIEIGMPDNASRLKIIEEQLKGFDVPFYSDNAKFRIISELIEDFSPSDMVSLLTKIKVKCVINGSNVIEYEDILIAIYEFSGKNSSVDNYIKFLNQHGVTQLSISKILNISMRQVRNILSEK